MADIDTLINGNLSSEHVHSLNIVAKEITGAKATVAEIDAAAIITGSIDTNKVTIHSDDGSMNLTGSLQQFYDENGVVRIQMGKDGKGNFTFGIFDETGTGVILNDQGLGERGIADGVIVNEHISSDTRIPGTKLDIDDVVWCINNSINNENDRKISYQKIRVDKTGNSLEVEFGELAEQVEWDRNRITSVATQVVANQNNIKTLMERVEIDDGGDGEGTSITEQLSSLTQTVEGITTEVSELETKYNEVSGKVDSVSDKQSTLEQTVDGFKLSVESTYVSKEAFDAEVEDLNAKINNVDVEISDDKIMSIVSSTFYSKEQVDSAISSSATATLDDVNSLYAKKDDLLNYRQETNSQLSQTSDEIMMKFTESLQYVTDVEGELTQFREEVSTKIRFSSDGIELGKTDSPFKTVLDNERLAFIEENNTVAYISNNKMNITNVEVQDELIMGNFSWVNINNHLRLRRR